MLEMKYFRKIERFEEKERKNPGRVEPFDVTVIGVDGIFATVQREYFRLLFIALGWLSRKFWPVMRIGRAVVVTRYEDVVTVLKRPEDFHVPFGPEITALAGGTNFMLGMDGPEQKKHRDVVVRDVMKDREKDLATMLEATRRYTKALIAGSGGRIDVMRDLLGRVFTEVSDEYFGLALEEPDDFLDRSFAISNVIFADLFGNPASRRAGMSASDYTQQVIRRAIRLTKAGKVQGDTFIRRLIDWRGEDGKTQSDADIVSIVIGTLTGSIPTNTMGAGKVIEELLRHPAYFAQAIDAARICASTTDEAVKALHRSRLYDIVLEAARLNPALFPGQWRYAPKDTQIGPHRVKGGSVLMVASMAALRDPRVFDQPSRFWPERPVDDPSAKPEMRKAWLIFGVGDHNCFGSFVAIEQIVEILTILLSQENIRVSGDPAGRLTYLGPYPRRLDMEFDGAPGRQGQNAITIHAPLRRGLELKPVQDAIAALGNPATDAIAARFEATGVVHFASLQAFDVRDPDDDEAASDYRLVLELSVDGTPEEALWSIANATFGDLAPIFECVLKDGERISSAAALYQLFMKNQVKLTYYPWETVGLAFNGTPDCSVHDIELQARIAGRARAELEAYTRKNGSPGTRPLVALRRVGEAVRSDPVLRDALIRPSRRRLALAEWKGQSTVAGLDAVFLSPPVVRIYAFLAMFALTASSVIWQMTHAPSSIAAGVTGILIACLVAMVCWPLVDSSLHLKVARLWLAARLWAVRGLVAGLAGAIACAVVGGNIALLYGAESYLWPGLWAPMKLIVAIVASWWLLKLEYVALFAFLDNIETIRKPVNIVAVSLGAVLVLAAIAYSGWGMDSLRPWLPQFANGLERYAVPTFSFVGEPGAFGTILQVVDEILFALMGGIASMLMGFLLLAGAFLAALRHHERRDVPDERTASREHIEEIAALENAPGYAQNHILAVTPMKEGWFRRLTLALGLWGIGIIVAYWCRPGLVLSMGSIHYARWLRLPNSDALVFLSNYDGSWESYLEDFVTKAHKGQTAAWTNGKGFPSTRFLVFDGVEVASRFKRWVRRQQRPSLFWYSRFPHLTTDHIRNNALIHHGLMRAATDTAAAAWLDCFGTMPRPDFKIESEKVQSLVFRGFPDRRYMLAARITLSEGIEARLAHDWLNYLEYHVWFGEPGISYEAAPTFVAFSATGLEKILQNADGKIPKDLLQTFPPAFRIGMAKRAKILRDFGPSAPSQWEWADADLPKAKGADAILLIYGKSEAECDAMLEKHRKKLEEMPSGSWSMECIRTSPTEKTLRALESGIFDRSYEHFGFRDGLSQPVIIGTQKSARDMAASDLVEPGEMILGYRDSSGHVPPPLAMPAEMDRHDDLPVDVKDFGFRFPRFGDVRGSSARDFGRNGTFIAIRQFEQHVDKFDDFTKAQADLLNDRREPRQISTLAGCPVDHEWIASKLMGRSRDGKLMLGRDIDDTDNDFDFGQDDPQGLQCPFGAHVRRANPRGALQPGDPFEPKLMKRHRLLRRGRAYSRSRNGEEGAEKGMMFMAICTDIERQFEFLQQTWIGSPSFAGLQNEPDPILGSAQPSVGAADGQSPRVFTIPTVAGPLKLELQPKDDFVTVKGGGYFFMPGLDALTFLASCTKPDKKPKP